MISQMSIGHNSNGDSYLSDVTVINKIPESIKAGASYSDRYNNLEELIENADMVLRGRVTKQYNHESGFSTITELNPTITYTGNSNSIIKVLQLKSEIQLELDKEYVLFLNQQGDSQDLYYIIGYGKQGIIEVAGDHLIVMDEIIKESISTELNNESLTFKSFEKLINN